VGREGGREGGREAGGTRGREGGNERNDRSVRLWLRSVNPRQGDYHSHGGVVLPVQIAHDTEKVRFEGAASTRSASPRRDWVMRVTAALALAFRAPSPDVETLASHQPAFAHLLGPVGDVTARCGD
jgi:hypothetical protein